jgi:predicted ArsR family transcriptional regulator
MLTYTDFTQPAKRETQFERFIEQLKAVMITNSPDAKNLDPDNNETSFPVSNVQLKREILALLYEASSESPYGRLSLSKLTGKLNIPRRDIKFQLDYLEEKGWIVSERSTRGIRVFCYYKITTRGIDLVEEPSEFSKQLPVVKHIHYGDTIQVGDIVSSKGIAIGTGAHAKAVEGISTEELKDLFEMIKVQVAGSVKADRQKEIENALDKVRKIVQEMEEQVSQGESPGEASLERSLKGLGKMAPDILEVAVATLTNPLAGLSLTVRKIADKAAEEVNK